MFDDLDKGLRKRDALGHGPGFRRQIEWSGAYKKARVASRFLDRAHCQHPTPAYDPDPAAQFEAFGEQPPGSGPIRALRDAIRDVLTRASAAEREGLRGRVQLLLSVPPLRATFVEQVRGPVRLLAEAMAERSGRRPDDPVVRAAAGAVMGVGLSAMFAAAEDPGLDVVSMLDEGLARLEAGLQL